MSESLLCRSYVGVREGPFLGTAGCSDDRLFGVLISGCRFREIEPGLKQRASERAAPK